jgi:hypothetical protein
MPGTGGLLDQHSIPLSLSNPQEQLFIRYMGVNRPS